MPDLYEKYSCMQSFGTMMAIGPAAVKRAIVMVSTRSVDFRQLHQKCIKYCRWHGTIPNREQVETIKSVYRNSASNRLA